jgi:hypothetical protein
MIFGTKFESYCRYYYCCYYHHQQQQLQQHHLKVAQLDQKSVQLDSPDGSSDG